jgi:hypothetical protein
MERDKLGRFIKGMKPHNYEIGMPKELKKKLEEKVYSKRRGKTYEEIYGKEKAKELLDLQKKSFTEERIKNITLKRKGMKLSEEHKKKIGEKSKGRIHTEESRQRVREKLLGHNVSEETRIKISKKTKGRKLTKEIKDKMSDRMKQEYKLGIRKPARRGIKLNEEERKKISERLKKSYLEGKRKPIRLIGKNNNFWKGGISFEPYDENFTKLFKINIRKRDNQVCMMCGIHREKIRRALNIHHINYDKKLSIPENCISLCDSCHGRTNDNREHWTKFFQSLLSERYGYKYSSNKEVILEVEHGLD